LQRKYIPLIKETGNIMANEHHLEILRQSNADTWKTWRLAHAFYGLICIALT
jgi:hypothetical protein